MDASVFWVTRLLLRSPPNWPVNCIITLPPMMEWSLGPAMVQWTHQGACSLSDRANKQIRYSWGSVKIYDVLSWLVFSWWEMCSCSSVRSYNAVLGPCPMVAVMDRCWIFWCEAIMVEFSLDAVLLSFFDFPALPSVRMLKNTHPVLT